MDKIIRTLTICFLSLAVASCGGSGGGRYSEDYEPDEYAPTIQDELDDKEAKIQELQQKISDLEEEREEMEEYQQDMNQFVNDLQDKSAEVDYQIDRLQTENWRKVVPDIENSQEDLQQEFMNQPFEP